MLYLENGSSTADVSLGGYGISVERMQRVDFSLSLLETDFQCVLLPAYRSSHGEPTLLESILRRSVIMVFGVMALTNFAVAILVVLLERRAGNPYFRLRHSDFVDSICCAFNVLTPGSSEVPFVSYWTRGLVCLNGLLMLFMLTIFTSLITSKLTANAISKDSISLDEMATLRVGVFHNTIMTPLLSRKRILYYECPDFMLCANSFFSGGGAEGEAYHGLDGICANSVTIAYLTMLHHKSSRWNPLFSDTFVINGSTTNFALPTRLQFPYARQLSLTLQVLRDEGVVNALNNKYFEFVELDEDDDISVGDTEYYAVLGVNLVAYAGLGAFIAALLVQRKKMQKTLEKEQQGRPGVSKTAAILDLDEDVAAKTLENVRMLAALDVTDAQRLLVSLKKTNASSTTSTLTSANATV
jgi:hypothetical protein